MNIRLDKLTKRFNREIIFSELDYEFSSGEKYAVIGPNGSGKSTLLQVISGFILPSSGNIHYEHSGDQIAAEDIYSHIAISSPFMELIEEFTTLEMIEFHFKFKKSLIPVDEILERSYLSNAKNKYISNFSSGMKQRLKLALAFFSESNILLLDEPTTNLDKKTIDWYQTNLNQISKRMVIIASNQQYEYECVKKIIEINDYKAFT